MADTQQSPIELESFDFDPDVPPANHIGIYPKDGALWAVLPDGTRRNLTGFTSLQAPPPVLVNTTYTVLANTQVVADDLEVAAGADLIIEAGAILVILGS